MRQKMLCSKRFFTTLQNVDLYKKVNRLLTKDWGFLHLSISFARVNIFHERFFLNCMLDREDFLFFFKISLKNTYLSIMMLKFMRSTV